MSAASFNTADPPETVVEHYRRLFGENGLAFSPTSNRFATTIRATAECGALSISIAGRESGSAVALELQLETAAAGC